jgi:prepilin-type processing-associated H-X9-DG protein
MNAFWQRRKWDVLGVMVALLVGGALFAWNRVVLQPKRHRVVCQQNLKQIGLAVLQYSRNYDEKLPMAANWSDALLPYIRPGGESGAASYVAQFSCPQRADRLYGYSYHQRLERKSFAVFDKPERIVMFFDSDVGRRSAADNGQSLANPPRHPGLTNIICYLDGHVKAQKQVNFSDGLNLQRLTLYQRLVKDGKWRIVEKLKKHSGDQDKAGTR